jgi:transcriptional regulator with XRE-family HTH domain
VIINILDPKDPGMRALQRARKRIGLKQADVATKMGVSQKRVSYLEGCDTQIMRLHHLAQYVEGLGGRLKVVVEFDVPRETSTD